MLHTIRITGSIDTGRTGRPVAGTAVVDSCTATSVPNGGMSSYQCLLIVNTGSKVYVASGTTGNPLESQSYLMYTLNSTGPASRSSSTPSVPPIWLPPSNLKSRPISADAKTLVERDAEIPPALPSVW